MAKQESRAELGASIRVLSNKMDGILEDLRKQSELLAGLLDREPGPHDESRRAD